MNASRPPRRRGRPSPDQTAAKLQILDALTRALSAEPLARPSLRSIAQAAGVTPALLHYHFTDLRGLLRGLYELRALPLLQPLLVELQLGQPAAGAALARFVQKWTTLCARNPWLAACLLQLPADELRPAERPAEVIREAVGAAQRQATVRGDLPAGYIALLLLSLGLLPHLSRTALGAGYADLVPPAAEPGVALNPQSLALQHLALQHLAVLQTGLAR